MPLGKDKAILVLTVMILIATPGIVNAASVAIDTVNDYSQNPYGLNNLNYANEFSNKILNVLNAHGISVVHWSDSWAWESDFEYEPYSPPLMDAYDMAIFSGHGGTGVFYFGTNTDKDGRITYQVDNSETYWSRKLKWVVIHACNTLYDSKTNREAWENYTFGNNIGYDKIELHAIYGFKTIAYDEWRVLWWYDNQAATGQSFAEKLVSGKTIANAWFEAIAEHEHPPFMEDAKGAILTLKITIQYAGGNQYTVRYINDHFPGFGSYADDPATLYQNFQNDPNAVAFILEWVYVSQ